MGKTNVLRLAPGEYVVGDQASFQEIETRVFPPRARFRIVEEIVKLISFMAVYPDAGQQMAFEHRLESLRNLLKQDHRTLIGEHLSKHRSKEWR